MQQKSGDNTSHSSQNTATKNTVASTLDTPVGRFSVHAVPAPATGFAIPGLTQAKISIIPENKKAAIAKALIKQLAKQQIHAQIVNQPPSDAEAVIFLGALQNKGVAENALSVNKAAFLTAKTIAKHFTQTGGIFVTVQDTGGDFGLQHSPEQQAWLGGLPGLVKTAALEWPKAYTKAIDIAQEQRSPTEIAKLICQELLQGGTEIEVGINSDAQRTTLITRTTPVTQAGNAVITENSILVVSGGARGVTAATLKGLAKAYQPKLVLLGRTPLAEESSATQNVKDDAQLKQAILQQAKAKGQKITPMELNRTCAGILATREVRANIAEMESYGSQVRYMPVDVRNQDAVNAALEQVRNEWGKITGLIHAAGMLADKRIEDKTEEQFEQVFSTKIDGLHTLLTALENDPLEVMCMFSSVAGRGGNVGQCDYAMANEVLNKVSQAERQARQDKCLVKSVNWGPWDGGMVTPALKAHFQSMGIALIPLAGGTDFLVKELTDIQADQVEVVVGGSQTDSPQLLGVNSTTRHMEIILNKSNYPYLLGHQIQGTVVVPMMQVVEWFSKAAQSCKPDMQVSGLEKIQVLKGIRAENFDQGEILSISCTPDENDAQRLHMQLSSTQGLHYYSADVIMRYPEETLAPQVHIAASEYTAWPWKKAEVYGKQLFHSNDFKVIEELKGVSKQGGQASLQSVIDKNWQNTWISDLAALDGGLQLAILWGYQEAGKTSLPTAIERLSFYQTPQSGLVDCQLQSTMVGKHRTQSDIIFNAANGQRLAEISGLQMHLLDS